MSHTWPFEDSSSSCHQVWYLLKPLSLICRWMPPCCVLTQCVLSACRPLVSSCVSNFPLLTRTSVRLDSCPSNFLLLMKTSVRLDSCPHILPNFTFCCCSVLSRVHLCDPMDCTAPGFPVLHHLPEFVQTHVYRVSDAIQPSHPLLPPSPFTFSLSQHLGLLQWVSF